MSGVAAMRDRLLALAQHVDWDELESVCEDIEHRPNGHIFVPDLLRILETNPDVDFGTVGPISHVVETFYANGCIEDVMASVRSSPNYYTIGMVQRLVNGTDGAERERYVAALQAIAKDERLSSYLRQLAQDFLARG